MSIWKKLLGVGAQVGGAALGGPIGGLLGGHVSEILTADDRDQFEKWCDFAKDLQKQGASTDAKREALRGRIRWDEYARTGAPPKDRHVEWLAQTVVMSIKGDFENGDEERADMEVPD